MAVLADLNYPTSGLSTVYGILSQGASMMVLATGAYSATSTRNSSNWASGVFTGTDSACANHYLFTAPAGASAAAGMWEFNAYLKLGASAAPTDLHLAGPLTIGISSVGTVIDGVNVTHVNQVAAVPGTSPGGSGADQVTLEFLDNVGAGIPDADVWVTGSASPTADVVAGTLQTDSDGLVTFLLDAGNTYYKWFQKDGYEPILGESFLAVAD